MQQAAKSRRLPEPIRSEEKFRRLLDEEHMLCKEDIVWVLDYIKQKAADKDQALLSLHQPRLLSNFHHFAEVALMLLHKRHAAEQEQLLMKSLLREASFGLHRPGDGADR